jgi:hypothetical protein
MALLGLNFQPDLGVQVAIHHWFGQPVNFFLIHGLKEFFLLVSRVAANFSSLRLLLVFCFKQYWGELRLILGHNVSWIGCSNSWFHPKMWDFMFTS